MACDGAYNLLPPMSHDVELMPKSVFPAQNLPRYEADRCDLDIGTVGFVQERLLKLHNF